CWDQLPRGEEPDEAGDAERCLAQPAPVPGRADGHVTPVGSVTTPSRPDREGVAALANAAGSAGRSWAPGRGRRTGRRVRRAPPGWRDGVPSRTPGSGPNPRPPRAARGCP